MEGHEKQTRVDSEHTKNRAKSPEQQNYHMEIYLKIITEAMPQSTTKTPLIQKFMEKFETSA